MIHPSIRMIYYYLLGNGLIFNTTIKDKKAMGVFWDTSSAREICEWHTDNGTQNYINYILTEKVLKT